MVLRLLNIYFLFTLFGIVSIHSVAQYVSGPQPLSYRNIYGETYGVDWIYFPDGKGKSHVVELQNIEDDRGLTELSSLGVELKIKRYKRNHYDYILFDSYGNILSGNMRIRDLFKNSIKIITHGWKSSEESMSVRAIKDAYVKVTDYDIITIDWSATASSFYYPKVARATKNVGEAIATFIDALSTRYNVKGHQIHLIGHSLGAHVMGVAGATAKMTIGRITGLDPARPLFEKSFVRKNLRRLDSNDATFVDVIHTCSGVLGFSKPIGTVDFYPNGGTAPQPGCEGPQTTMESCSHGRAPQYFAASIQNPALYPAYRCSNWNLFLRKSCDQISFMGDNINRDARGTFYLMTEEIYANKLKAVKHFF